MAIVTIPPPNAVAMRTASLSMPAMLSRFGAKKRIYAMVIKVVKPAIISPFTVVLRSLSANSFSNICDLLYVLEL